MSAFALILVRLRHISIIHRQQFTTMRYSVTFSLLNKLLSLLASAVNISIMPHFKTCLFAFVFAEV